MEQETLIRLGVFLILFVGLALAEHWAPRRPRIRSRRQRWLTHAALSLLNTGLLRLMSLALPLLAIGAAIDAQSRGWGFFNHRDWPMWLEWVLAILLLDFAIWAQHLATHKIPLLWRLHRVHHSDTEFDVSTAIRFHPIEIALSMLFKIALVYPLGVAPMAVVLFEILLNGTALFNHSNWNLPKPLDRILRLVLVTPDMHRVHHSVHREEHDSNYGFSLSIWDRLMKTYRAQPLEGHEKMTIGLTWQNTQPARLGWALRLPFARKND